MSSPQVNTPEGQLAEETFPKYNVHELYDKLLEEREVTFRQRDELDTHKEQIYSLKERVHVLVQEVHELTVQEKFTVQDYEFKIREIKRQHRKELKKASKHQNEYKSFMDAVKQEKPFYYVNEQGLPKSVKYTIEES